jgi:hypothetical protein
MFMYSLSYYPLPIQASLYYPPFPPYFWVLTLPPILREYARFNKPPLNLAELSLHAALRHKTPPGGG